MTNITFFLKPLSPLDRREQSALKDSGLQKQENTGCFLKADLNSNNTIIITVPPPLTFL